MLVLRWKRLGTVGADEINGVFDRLDLFRGIIGDFAPEFFFKSHNQFYCIQAICTEIVDKACALYHLGIFNTEVLNNNLLTRSAMSLIVVSPCNGLEL